MNKKILIIDGSIWLYKNSISLTPLYNVDFIDVSVIYYTLRKIYNEILLYKPNEVHIIFDIGRDIRKKQRYEKYKNNRHVRKIYKDTLSENLIYERLSFSRKVIHEILSYTPIKSYLIPFLEGDTIIAYICNKFKDLDKIVISNDKDMYQLIDDNTSIISTNNKLRINEVISVSSIDKIWEDIVGKPVLLSKIINEYNVNSISFKSIPYYRSFLGDVSDGIPGITGVGKEIITYLIQYQQFSNKTIFKDSNDFFNFFIKNKEDIYKNYTLINKFIYNRNKKSLKKLDNFYNLINDDDVKNTWNIFFELMCFEYAINNIPVNLIQELISIIESRSNYNKDDFISHIKKYDLDSTNEYIKWDIINNILCNNHDWNVINTLSSQNISNFEILFNSLISKYL